MEKFNPLKNFKKSIESSKGLVKKAIIAGSIVLSAEQGLAQSEPNKNDKYIPEKNWTFDKESDGYDALKKSELYPGYFEDYDRNDDSTYHFTGYRTEDGEMIRPLKDVESDIVRVQEKIAYCSNTQKIREAFDHQFTQEYKEECYNRAFKKQQGDISKEKKDVEDFKSLLSAKNKDSTYYKRINNFIVEHEERLRGLTNYLTDELLDKEKAMKDSAIVPIYSYEEKASQFEASKEFAKQELDKLLKEKEKIEKYINNFDNK